MWLAVTDDAGNTVTKEWKIEIIDGNSPIVLGDYSKIFEMVPPRLEYQA